MPNPEVTVQRATLRRRSPSSGGFSLLEILVVLAVLSLLAIIAVTHLLGTRQKAWDAACDDNHYKLVGELNNEMDSRLARGETDAAKQALLNSASINGDFLNPFNLQIDAYQLVDDTDPACPTAFVPTAATKCQVTFCYEGANSVVGHQFWPTEPRSFRITIE